MVGSPGIWARWRPSPERLHAARSAPLGTAFYTRPIPFYAVCYLAVLIVVPSPLDWAIPVFGAVMWLSGLAWLNAKIRRAREHSYRVVPKSAGAVGRASGNPPERGEAAIA